MKKIFYVFTLMVLAASCGQPIFKSAAERGSGSGDVVLVSIEEAVRYENVYEYIKAKFPTLVVSRDGGSSYSIRIRGINSITGPNEPVLVLDGMEVSNFDGVNVPDIEKIEVLKGPRSYTYGSSSTNGVIHITTKR